MLGGADPLEQSVKQLLVAYQAETHEARGIHYIDPERDVLALEDVKKRFKIEAGPHRGRARRRRRDRRRRPR